jgi:hypothetical protein
MSPLSRRVSIVRATALVLLPILLAACISRSRPPKEASNSLGCGIEGFTLSALEHIVNEIRDPIVVRQVQGRISDIDGIAIWYEGHFPLLEIKAQGVNKTKVRGVYADRNGVFKMEGVPEGRYCFKATMDGWQSVMGIIIVSKKADPKSTIILRLPVGV